MEYIIGGIMLLVVGLAMLSLGVGGWLLFAGDESAKPSPPPRVLTPDPAAREPSPVSEIAYVPPAAKASPADRLCDLAVELAQAGEFDEAIELFTKSLRLRGYSPKRSPAPAEATA